MSDRVDHIDACWSRVGVSGDKTCPELKRVIHCRNCPVYSAGGRGLLDRAAPQGYLDEWTGVLAREKEERPQDTASAVIFRLGGEWLALATGVFKEMTEVRVIHRLPHRSNDILLGIVNIGGEIQLCVSLAGLLGLEPSEDADADARHGVYRRMAVVERERERWVFGVDEVHGIHRFRAGDLERAPVTVSRAASTYTKGMISWQGRSVGFLDDELLFYSLKRNLL